MLQMALLPFSDWWAAEIASLSSLFLLSIAWTHTWMIHTCKLPKRSAFIEVNWLADVRSVLIPVEILRVCLVFQTLLLHFIIIPFFRNNDMIWMIITPYCFYYVLICKNFNWCAHCFCLSQSQNWSPTIFESRLFRLDFSVLSIQTVEESSKNNTFLSCPHWKELPTKLDFINPVSWTCSILHPELPDVNTCRSLSH